MSIDVFKLPVFPAADVFPMMVDEELQELAEDIKENGVREPIVIANGQLVDGRNRRAACKIAGVVPPTRELNGEDLKAYVISANIHRRHMTKGQQAMAVAMVYPEPEKGGRGKNSFVSKGFISDSRLSLARTVLTFASDLAPNVLRGFVPLDKAYEVAFSRKQAASSDETKLEELRSRHPVLADKVVEDELTLSGALAEARERDAQKREKQQAAFRIIKEALFHGGAFSIAAQVDDISEILGDADAQKDFLKHFKDDPAELTKQLDAFETGAPRLIALVKGAM